MLDFYFFQFFMIWNFQRAISLNAYIATN